MNNELLPCPFCGDDEIMDFQAHLENRVQCAMCNVSTDTFPSCEESHAAWNTRTKAAPTEPQSDSVIVPRGLLERVINKMNIVWQKTDEVTELRALLGGDQPAQPVSAKGGEE